jgi:hypothetical protein
MSGSPYDLFELTPGEGSPTEARAVSQPLRYETSHRLNDRDDGSALIFVESYEFARGQRFS